MDKMTTRKFIIRFFQYCALLFYYLVFFIPVIWVFYTSFRNDNAILSGTIFSNPEGLTLKHYGEVLYSQVFPRYTYNSFRIAMMTVIMVVAIGLTGSYVLSRYRLKAKGAIFFALLSSQMFPGVLMLISLFSFFYRINLTNSAFGIALGHMVGGLPFAILMMKSYIDAIPTELDEAGRIDGLGVFGILTNVILPLAAPGIAVAAFYAFMVSWGDYVFASVLSTTIKTQTLPLGLARYFSAQQIKWGLINAATIITIAPTILLFAILQKQVVSGLTSGAVKG